MGTTHPINQSHVSTKPLHWTEPLIERNHAGHHCIKRQILFLWKLNLLQILSVLPLCRRDRLPGHYRDQAIYIVQFHQNYQLVPDWDKVGNVFQLNLSNNIQCKSINKFSFFFKCQYKFNPKIKNNIFSPHVFSYHQMHSKAKNMLLLLMWKKQTKPLALVFFQTLDCHFLWNLLHHCNLLHQTQHTRYEDYSCKKIYLLLANIKWREYYICNATVLCFVLCSVVYTRCITVDFPTNSVVY